MNRKITIPESVSKRISDLKFPELTVPKVTIPDEARRPFYATVGAAEIAVERVRGAMLTAQDRVVETQKDLTEKASTVVGHTKDTASSAYADFTKRGAAVIGRVWPEAVETTPVTVKKPASKKSTARKPAAKKPVAPKVAAVKKPVAPKVAAVKKPVAPKVASAEKPAPATPVAVAVTAEVTKES